MIQRLIRLVLLLGVAWLPVGMAFAQTTTFAYTGSVQTFTVPAGVTTLTLTVAGAGGGGGGLDSNGAGGNGGSGAAISATYAVTAGAVLSVYVGGGGGLGASGVTCAGGGSGGTNSLTGGNGGNAGCSGSSGAGGGGGAPSGVMTSGGTVLLVAGGGGGGQGGSVNASPALAGVSSTATGAVAALASGASAATFGSDGGGGGGGGGGCSAGAAGGGHADGVNGGTAAGAGGSCATTSLVSNFQVLGTAGGAGGAGTSSTVAGSAGGNGSVIIAYGSGSVFVYTGSVQTYTVPAGMNWVTFTLNGAGGGGAGADSGGNGGNGGYGASASGTYPVTPGAILYIYVGGGGAGGNSSTGSNDCTNAAGAGGWSDYAGASGGQAGCSGWSGAGAGGGGATTITTSTGTVLMVAGGGGGGQGGSLSTTGLTGGNATASGALPAAAGTAGASWSGDGGGGGGGGGGCSAGSAGVGHADGSSGGSAAGAGGSCYSTTLVNNFQILGAGGAGGTGATAGGVQGTGGSNGIVFIASSTGPNHYSVTHASTGVNCQPEPVTVVGHTSTHTVSATTTRITVTTSTGHGDWTLSSGSGTFAAGASNAGTATYSYVTADAGSVILSLRDTYAETVTVNVTDGVATQSTGAALASENTTLTFAPSGFRFTNGANVGTSIATQLAGVTSTQSLALQAVRTDTTTGACTAAFASGQTVNVSVAYQCNNPTACVAGQSFSLTNNAVTTALASNPNSGLSAYSTVPLKFSTANAEAPISLRYTDAGQITLAARYAIPLGSGAASGNLMSGAGQFVVQPYALKLSNVKASTSGTVNPGASTAAGAVFLGAGQAFTATVTASNLQGTATPNFGQETSPPTVTLTPTLVLPATGQNPAVAGGFGAFSGGAATGTGFAWAEVGIITLTPGVANYLASGAVTGTASGNVGRFVPASFAAAVNTPVFGTACSAGGFTYVGQPFTYTVAPVVTLTALALGNTTTQNYTGSLMRLTNGSLTGRAYTPTPASPALTLTGLPAAGVDPVIADLTAGRVSLTFGAGSGLAYARGSAAAPFNANIALSINVLDLDGVAAANPVTFGGSGGIAFSTGTSQFYGRLALANALGSELLDLPMPLTTQYYLNSSQGFVTNTGDSCTTAPTLAFGSYRVNLAAGETCVRDSGSPGASAQGCAVAAANRYYGTAAAGTFNLILASPGSGNAGALTVTATAPAWLQYLWNAGSGVNSSPSALATFGVYPGSASRVYQREIY